MRDRLKYQEEQFNFMADALTERCWVCTKLCDDERGCIVAPEAYAGHDVLACSDNHFNRAYEMAMGIKPANRTFYDFARVAERRDEGRGKDYGFRIQEIIFEPNFPPYRRDELSKSLRAETLSDKEYRQLLKEIMLSTQSKGEFEWAVSEIRKLNKKGAESFEADEKVNERTFLVSVREYDEPVWLIALRDDNDPDYRPMTDEEWKKATQSLPQNFTFRIPIYFSDFAPEWRIITDEVKEKIADETGWFPLYFSIHERLEDGSVVEVEMWSAESFEADCRDCYGTGGLYDSRLGIDDECASCGGTGESFEAEIYDRQGNLRTVDDSFIEATIDKLQALNRLFEANRKQILATNNQDTKTRLRAERYQIQDVMARLRAFIDDPINHDGGDFMVRLGAESFEAEQIQYDVMKGKFAKGHEYANYISLHDSFRRSRSSSKARTQKVRKG